MAKAGHEKKSSKRRFCFPTPNRSEVIFLLTLNHAGLGTKNKKQPCVHCRRVTSICCRRLCFICYYDPKIIKLYPIKNPKHRPRRGLGIIDQSKPAKKPTAYKCGSNKKIRVMAKRAKANQELHHPKDSLYRIN